MGEESMELGVLVSQLSVSPWLFQNKTLLRISLRNQKKRKLTIQTSFLIRNQQLSSFKFLRQFKLDRHFALWKLLMKNVTCHTLNKGHRATALHPPPPNPQHCTLRGLRTGKQTVAPDSQGAATAMTSVSPDCCIFPHTGKPQIPSDAWFSLINGTFWRSDYLVFDAKTPIYPGSSLASWDQSLGAIWVAVSPAWVLSFAHQIKPNSRPFWLCIFFHQQSGRRN